MLLLFLFYLRRIAVSCQDSFLLEGEKYQQSTMTPEFDGLFTKQSKRNNNTVNTYLIQIRNSKILKYCIRLLGGSASSNVPMVATTVATLAISVSLGGIERGVSDFFESLPLSARQ